MRVDKFLNAVNITKRRAVAQDMCNSSVVFVNEVTAKPSREVKVGDRIDIQYFEKTVSYDVLAIPTTKTVPKADQEQYIKVVQ